MKIFLSSLLVFLTAQLSAAAKTSIIPINDGRYALSYNIDLEDITQGNDVIGVIAAAMDEAGHIELCREFPQTWAGTGETLTFHTFSFRPVKAVIFGVTQAIEGGLDGTDKDHIVLAGSSVFVANAKGKKWRQIFPGVEGHDRMRHSAFTQLVKDLSADPTDNLLRDKLLLFLQVELLPVAGFDPQVSFRAIRFSTGEAEGTIFEDFNGNGVYDSGEGIAGANVTLDPGNCTYSPGIRLEAISNSRGTYDVGDSSLASCTLYPYINASCSSPCYPS